MPSAPQKQLLDKWLTTLNMFLSTRWKYIFPLLLHQLRINTLTHTHTHTYTHTPTHTHTHTHTHTNTRICLIPHTKVYKVNTRWKMLKVKSATFCFNKKVSQSLFIKQNRPALNMPPLLFLEGIKLCA